MTIPLVALAGALALWLFAMALTKPRLLVYAIFALAPTQFIFIPVSSFFLSPADVLVLAAAAGFAVRLAAGDRYSITALWHHRYVVLLLVSYVLGFAVLGVFSRTLIRVPMAVVPSVLACEAFRKRVHLRRAATALVIAGALDAAYGVYYYVVLGTPLHPTRFSGLSGLNFSATVIITAAVVLFAKEAVARKWTTLARPGAFIALGAATLSQAGMLAFLASWLVVLRRAMTRRNVVRITAVALVVVAAALSSGTVRERLASRNQRTLEIDGIERNSADVRRMVLAVAWKAFNESPFIGIGYAQFAPYSTIDPDIDNTTLGQGYGTHNTYVEVLVEAGIIGFVCFALHFAQFLPRLRLAMTHISRRKDAITASALVALPLVLVAAALINLLLVYHFWAVCGLALACLARKDLVFGTSPHSLWARPAVTAAVGPVVLLDSPAELPRRRQ